MSTEPEVGVAARERAIPTDTFEARLMLARLHAGRLTIREAAARCGFTNESWSNWERGKRPRDIIEVAERVSEVLGVDRDWLMFGGALTRPARVNVRSKDGLMQLSGVGSGRPRSWDNLHAAASTEQPQPARPVSPPPEGHPATDYASHTTRVGRTRRAVRIRSGVTR